MGKLCAVLSELDPIIALVSSQEMLDKLSQNLNQTSNQTFQKSWSLARAHLHCLRGSIFLNRVLSGDLENIQDLISKAMVT